MINAPMGAKMRPIMKMVGKTALGVKMGCHAFNRCCLNAVSARQLCMIYTYWLAV
jgi:hypothetical protein